MNSRLGRELIAGGQKYHAHFVPDDDLTAEFYEVACERLNAAGRAIRNLNFARADESAQFEILTRHLISGLESMRIDVAFGGGRGAVSNRMRWRSMWLGRRRIASLYLRRRHCRRHFSGAAAKSGIDLAEIAKFGDEALGGYSDAL
jgi:hypothetical protein